MEVLTPDFRNKPGAVEAVADARREAARLQQPLRNEPERDARHGQARVDQVLVHAGRALSLGRVLQRHALQRGRELGIGVHHRLGLGGIRSVDLLVGLGRQRGHGGCAGAHVGGDAHDVRAAAAVVEEATHAMRDEHVRQIGAKRIRGRGRRFVRILLARGRQRRHRAA